MDAGTAYEIGFMRPLGRPVFGYTNTRADYAARARIARAAPRPDYDCDRPAFEIEDFELGENLMIEVAVMETPAEVVRGEAPPSAAMADLAAFERCLGLVAAHFRTAAR